MEKQPNLIDTLRRLGIPSTELPGFITQIISSLHQEQEKRFATAYITTLSRIQKETSALKPFQELGMLDDLYFGFDGLVGNTKVVWNNPEVASDGQFDVVTDTISSRHQPPTKVEILTSLALLGTVPAHVDLVAHELLHKHEWPYSAARRLQMIALNGPIFENHFFPGRELMEVIAYRLTDHEPHESTPDRLLNHLLTATDSQGRRPYAQFGSDRLLYSIHAIDTLLAFNLHTIAICRIALQPGGWDCQSHRYPQLARAVNNLSRINHITSPEDLAALKSAYVLKRLQDTHASQRIAVNEIIRAAIA